MSHSLTAIVGLGIVLGTGALVKPEPVQSDELAQTEVAPGTSIPPLGTKSSRMPAFVLINPDASVSVVQAEPPLTIGTSGLMAFGPGGIRMPAYEAPDVPTGSLKRTPKR